MDLLFSTSNMIAYFKKQCLLPHPWSGCDLQKELTSLQKSCITLQLTKVNKLLEKGGGLGCGAGLTPLECALKENACVLLSDFNPNRKTYRYHINSYTSRRRVKTRRCILTALLRAETHKGSGWSVERPSEIPWSIIDKDESQIIVDYVDLSTRQVLESIAHGWINWQKSIHYTSSETFFLNHLSPFYIRYPRCCMRHQSKQMLARVKHGISPDMFHTVAQLLVTLLDNALVFQAMLACYRLVNGPSIRVSDFDWISQNLSSIFETDFYRWKSIYRALMEYINLTLSESVREFDNNIREKVPHQLPGYVLTRFKVLARGLACMDREENRYLGKLLLPTLRVIEYITPVFNVKYVGEDLDKLACCVISALTTFRHEVDKDSEIFDKLKSCTLKLMAAADSSLDDYLPFVLMRQAISNIPIEIQEIYIPNIFHFIADVGVDLNIRSKLNNENLLLTCISNYNFTSLLLEMLLSIKVYPFTVNKIGVCFATRVNQFFTGGYCRLDEDDLESLEFLKIDYPILQKPFSLTVLAARQSGKTIEKFPSLVDLIRPQRNLFEFIKLHMSDPSIMGDS